MRVQQPGQEEREEAGGQADGEAAQAPQEGEKEEAEVKVTVQGQSLQEAGSLLRRRQDELLQVISILQKLK